MLLLLPICVLVLMATVWMTVLTVTLVMVVLFFFIVPGGGGKSACNNIFIAHVLTVAAPENEARGTA